jgi:hypothetical protein
MSRVLEAAVEPFFGYGVGDCGGWPSWEVENWTWVGISVQRPWLSMQL